MSKIALFPGSFDPVTVGHVDVVKRTLDLFDELIIAIGQNTDKKYLFPLEKREAWLKKVFSAEKKVKVMTYQGLTVDFCRKAGARYIVRGLRTSADFEFERGIAQMNRAMAPDIETVFVITDPALSALNSTIVRDIIRHGGDASAFVPGEVKL